MLAQGSLIIYGECLLVVYLLQRSTYTSISYIKVSKSSCKLCFLWLQAVCQNTGCHFNIKASHDKWYPRWSAPALEDNEHNSTIDKRFHEKVESEMCEYLKDSNIARPWSQSDSSNYSDRSKTIMNAKLVRDNSSKMRFNYPFFVNKKKKWVAAYRSGIWFQNEKSYLLYAFYFLLQTTHP